MFGIPPQSREIYSSNFIRSVQLKASYASTPQCSEDRERFKDLFSDSFPKIDDATAVRIELNGKGSNVTTHTDDHRLVLRSENLQKEIAFTNDECLFTVSGDNYKSFDEVSKQYKKALFFVQTCGVHTLNFLSLRKVNVVQFSAETNGDSIVPIHGALQQLISNGLLIDYDNRFSINSFLKQSFQTIVLQDTGYELTIKYGVEALRRENSSKKVSGIVVIDLSIKKNQIPVDVLEVELDKFNNEIYSAFRWILSDNAINLLKDGH